MNWRVPAGFVLAPLVPCALYATAVGVIANQWSGFRFIVVAMVTVSEALCLFVALPLFLVLRRFRSIALLECVAAGVAITILVNVISLLVSGGPGYSAGDSGGATVINGHLTGHGFMSAIVGTAVQSLLGAAIGLCFWIIAVRPVHHGSDSA
jgi:hypothetical protein